MPNKKQLLCGNGSLMTLAQDTLGAVALDPLGGKRSANKETATAETQTGLHIPNDKFLWKTVNTEIILRPSLLNGKSHILTQYTLYNRFKETENSMQTCLYKVTKILKLISMHITKHIVFLCVVRLYM